MADDLGFIDPTARGGKTPIPMAQRPADLAGKVVGLLDNGKEPADVILQTLEHALRDRYGVSRVVTRRTASYTMAAPQEMLDEMAREVDVAITALGG